MRAYIQLWGIAGVLVVAAIAATLPIWAYACQPLEQNEFGDIAPTAKNILAFQIESLELGAESMQGDVHAIEGRIRVLRKYRESNDDFQRIHFSNTLCHGRRLDVGGIYLIATNSSPPTMELDPADAALLQLSGAFPFDPQTVLRASRTIERLRDALSGEGDFNIGADMESQSMVRERPPPPVPPPEELCMLMCGALNKPSQSKEPVSDAAAER